MDEEIGLEAHHKKENSNFMIKFKVILRKFIFRMKLVAKKLSHFPIILLCLLFFSSIFPYTLTPIKCIIFTMIIQFVIFLYPLFFRKTKIKKYL